MAFLKALEYALCACFVSILFLFDSINILNFCKGIDNSITWLNLCLGEQHYILLVKLDANICWISRSGSQVARGLPASARHCTLASNEVCLLF